MTQQLALPAKVKNTLSRASFSPGRYEPKASSALAGYGFSLYWQPIFKNKAFENSHENRTTLDNWDRRAQTKGAGGAR